MPSSSSEVGLWSSAHWQLSAAVALVLLLPGPACPGLRLCMEVCQKLCLAQATDALGSKWQKGQCYFAEHVRSSSYPGSAEQICAAGPWSDPALLHPSWGVEELLQCLWLQLCGRRLKNVLCPGRPKSKGCWQLGAKAVRQAAAMTAFDMFFICQGAVPLPSAVTAHLEMGFPVPSPTSVHLSFCTLVFAERRNAWRTGGW